MAASVNRLHTTAGGAKNLGGLPLQAQSARGGRRGPRCCSSSAHQAPISKAHARAQRVYAELSWHSNPAWALCTLTVLSGRLISRLMRGPAQSTALASSTPGTAPRSSSLVPRSPLAPIILVRVRGAVRGAAPPLAVLVLGLLRPLLLFFFPALPLLLPPLLLLAVPPLALLALPAGRRSRRECTGVGTHLCAWRGATCV